MGEGQRRVVALERQVAHWAQQLRLLVWSLRLLGAICGFAASPAPT